MAPKRAALCHRDGSMALLRKGMINLASLKTPQRDKADDTFLRRAGAAKLQRIKKNQQWT